MHNDPLLPNQSLMPDFSDSDELIPEEESSTEIEEVVSKACSTVGECSEQLNGTVEKHQLPRKSSAELSLELEKILTDLEKNSFRECVAEVLGKDVEMSDDFLNKDYLFLDSCDSNLLGPECRAGEGENETFVYDTSSSESLVAPAADGLARQPQSSPLDEQVARIAPWREIFPPLHIRHRFPQRALYWLSTSLKNQVIATPVNQ